MMILMISGWMDYLTRQKLRIPTERNDLIALEELRPNKVGESSEKDRNAAEGGAIVSFSLSTSLPVQLLPSSVLLLTTVRHLMIMTFIRRPGAPLIAASHSYLFTFVFFFFCLNYHDASAHAPMRKPAASLPCESHSSPLPSASYPPSSPL